MAKAQWIAVEVCPHNLDVKIKNARLNFGIFYANNDKDVSISSDIINNLTIAAKESKTFTSCGAPDSASGTEGQFDLYTGDTKIASIYWSCPWGSRSNTLEISEISHPNQYLIHLDGGNGSGAIGNVRVQIVKI
jgi:hypothetical protein